MAKRSVIECVFLVLCAAYGGGCSDSESSPSAEASGAEGRFMSDWPSLTSLLSLISGSAGCRSPTPDPDGGCPEDEVSFWLYKRDGPSDGVRVYPDDGGGSLDEAGFDPSLPVKILIHGYTGHRNYDPNPQVRPAYLRAGDYNVISVDWSPLAKEPCYFSAANGVPVVGNCTGRLVDTIARAGVPPEEVHVVGFSLGAHVSGHVGKHVTTGRIGRVTGLDPALPFFASVFDDSILDPSDAMFVDVLHTNAGNKGKMGPNGHVDFYLNGGFMQPGCQSQGETFIDRHSCSHTRATEVFAESISSEEGFWGTHCSNWMEHVAGLCTESAEKVLMGEHVDPRLRGTYYVNTNAAPPFAMGKS